MHLGIDSYVYSGKLGDVSNQLSEIDMTFAAQADRQYAEAKGSERRDQQWILSDRDVWYRNPFYKGPPQPHPEDDESDYD